MAIYLDSASTSYPKPEAMCRALTEYFRGPGVSPGRGGYASARAADALVTSARQSIAAYLGCRRPEQLNFTPGATFGLNYCIKGSVARGDHVVATDTEHNSVLRPLERLRRAGDISYSIAHGHGSGPADADAVEAVLQDNTRLIVVNHASNVTGVVNEVENIIALGRRRGILVLVDGSQTVGHLAIDVEQLDVDMFCFSAHKGMLGPPGLGAVYLRRGIRLATVVEGGTGNNSQSLLQPGAGTARYEPGTLNAPGIIATAAALCSAERRSEAALERLASAAAHELAALDRIEVFGHLERRRVPVFAFRVGGIPSAEVSAALDQDFGIETRAGLHCAPLIHRRLGSFPQGLVRVSIGHATTESDIEQLLSAVRQIAGARSTPSVA